MVLVVKSIVNLPKLSVQCENIVHSGIQINKAFFIPKYELEISTSLSGGSGGQHVNKTNTKVVLRWNIKKSLVLNEYQRTLLLKKLHLTTEGELVILSDESRSQRQNINNALKKCKHRVEQALIVPKKRKPTKPTRSSQRKRVERKKHHAEKKQNRRKPDIP